MQKECNKRHFAVSRNSESICKSSTDALQREERCSVRTLAIHMQNNYKYYTTKGTVQCYDTKSLYAKEVEIRYCTRTREIFTQKNYMYATTRRTWQDQDTGVFYQKELQVRYNKKSATVGGHW